MATTKTTKYDANSIKILEGLEAVRKRPGMYIGSTDKRGLHHLAWEIIDNCIDEIINGYGDTIKIRLNEDGSITIADNGRGVPIGKHESGKSAAEVIYTVLHAGGKFEEGNYKVSGGLHGVGASVVNALSDWMDVTIYTEGKISNIRFKNGGEVASSLKTIGESKKTGTCVTFMPNYEIFKNCQFSFSTICERMQESAFLLPQLIVELENAKEEKKVKYHYENGIENFVEYINEDKTPINGIVPIHELHLCSQQVGHTAQGHVCTLFVQQIPAAHPVEISVGQYVIAPDGHVQSEQVRLC